MNARWGLWIKFKLSGLGNPDHSNLGFETLFIL